MLARRQIYPIPRLFSRLFATQLDPILVIVLARTTQREMVVLVEGVVLTQSQVGMPQFAIPMM